MQLKEYSQLSHLLPVVEGDIEQDGGHPAPADNNNPNQPRKLAVSQVLTTRWLTVVQDGPTKLG